VARRFCSYFCQLLAFSLCLGAWGTTSAEGAKFAAIAWSATTGSHGFGFNYSTSKDAENRALGECRSRGATDCVVRLAINEGCGALASSGPNGFVALGADSGSAERQALDGCGKRAQRCKLVRSVCTDKAVEMNSQPPRSAPQPVSPPRLAQSQPSEDSIYDLLPPEMIPMARDAVKNLERAQRGRDIGQFFVFLVGLIIFVKFSRGILRIRAKMREALSQAASKLPSQKTPDWILDRASGAKPGSRSQRTASRPPQPMQAADSFRSRETGPLQGAIVRREARAAVEDMNRSRRYYREQH